jgi:predicted homoserine dehydrogenase-like protein
MIIVDTALKKREAEGRPIRVGMVGAGFMGRGVALQILGVVPGMDLVAISNRHVEGARRAYEEAGVAGLREVRTQQEMDAAIAQGEYAITDDPNLICRAEGIDAVLEVTGAVEFSAAVALEAIKHKKHTIVMNAELDGTVGPILKAYADEAGVIFTNTDGDQPGVMMNLYRFVKGIGVEPVMCGNIKGLHDPYRNPTTQEGFARQWKQKPHMVASFADGTKISFEQAIVANATGMRVAQRGMWGPTVPNGTPLDEAIKSFPQDELLAEGTPGFVDYLVGAVPAPGVFVIGRHDQPLQQHYLNLYKLGQGPLYLFYTPYHLCHFEVHNTIARAVLFDDATLAPIAPMVEVVTAAKIDLKSGETIDGLGYYMTYGLAENADIVDRDDLLPIGVAEGCVLTREVAKDEVLTYADVRLPGGRLIDRLRQEQRERFSRIHATNFGPAAATLSQRWAGVRS